MLSITDQIPGSSDLRRYSKVSKFSHSAVPRTVYGTTLNTAVTPGDRGHSLEVTHGHGHGHGHGELSDG